MLGNQASWKIEKRTFEREKGRVIKIGATEKTSRRRIKTGQGTINKKKKKKKEKKDTLYIRDSWLSNHLQIYKIYLKSFLKNFIIMNMKKPSGATYISNTTVYRENQGK